MTILWWHWLLLGLFLVVAEIAAAGGFYIIFFGIGAIVVGLLASAGLAGPLWVQMLLFSAVSIAGLIVFRRHMLRWFQHDPQVPTVDLIVGEIGVATEDLQPGGVGRVELRGSGWSARNRSGVPVSRGSRIRVVAVDGLMLDVVSEGAH